MRKAKDQNSDWIGSILMGEIQMDTGKSTNKKLCKW